eukprot:gene4377-5121_t
MSDTSDYDEGEEMDEMDEVDMMNDEDCLGIRLPWEFDWAAYNNFLLDNSKITLPSFEYYRYKSKKSIQIPLATHVNISKGEGPSTVISKDIGGLPSCQNVEIASNLDTWNDQAAKEKGCVFNCKAQFRIMIDNIPYYYKPSASFVTKNRYLEIPLKLRQEEGFKIPPDFVVEVRKYSNRPGNALDYQLTRMARWISGGVQSGILFDGRGGNVYLFCQSNLLVNGNHPLAVEQQKIARLQVKQEYFTNMIPYPGFNNQVSFKTIPFWSNQPQTSTHKGPDIVVHFIGVVNGFKLDLSTVRLS